MVINSTDSFAAKPDARLVRLLLRARRFKTTLAQGEGVPFAALAEREGVSRSYFTRLDAVSAMPRRSERSQDQGLAWVDL